MLKGLKFKGDESLFFFISDGHIRHNRDFIFVRRGYKTVEEHDNSIIHAWNATVPQKGIVFHLGDFIFKDPDGKAFWELTRRLTFEKLYLLWGNHTSGQRQAYIQTLKQQFPDAVSDLGEINYEIYPLTANLGHKSVIFLPQYTEVTINSTPIVLCHYPIMSFHGDGKSGYHFCGHSHSNNPHTNKDTGVGRRLDVGVESFGRPISLLEAKNHLKNREIHTFDHHGKKEEEKE